jgi:hypothetical protein
MSDLSDGLNKKFRPLDHPAPDCGEQADDTQPTV